MNPGVLMRWGQAVMRGLLHLTWGVVLFVCVGSLSGCAPGLDEVQEQGSATPTERPELLPEAGSQAAGSVRAAQELMDRLVGPRNTVTVSRMENGWFEVRGGGSYGYIDPGVTYFIEGDLVNLHSGDNLTEATRRKDRVEVLATLDDGLITYAPPDADPRYTLTVFTDTECGYCRKLHREIDDYLAEGITVRYVLYSRSGKGSGAYRAAEKVWCSADRKQALTAAKAGDGLPGVSRCETPLAANLAAGGRLGIAGTPTGFLPDGEMIRGYAPAAQLKRRMMAHYGVGETVGMDAGQP